jgi:hypothetical protein
MVKVSAAAIDQSMAWRVRDALASHPLLGGATACISVVAGPDRIVLEGWTLDEHVRQIALRMALRSAGKRPVQANLRARPHPTRPTLLPRLGAPNA